ncbi:hypothetical protein [Mesoterricola silvestris]|uniref:Outer membrane protein beta-barrel domain-containing protein n=1 Tax=Mesoterricola silvestris TaxID=2927979 RepID=A0AA48H5F7_9BACT|nr:hypothetical protein [Mesoterricola silvestris]BDU72198.1 hypothetical protein METEAL_13720 [Mesoterricola silvestris]
MRTLVLSAAMAASLPALAQAPGAWYLDLHRVAPTLEGNYTGMQDGKPVNFDIVKDLALAKDGAKVGVGLEYQGPRFGLELAVESQDYLGSNLITRDVTISGQTWNAQATVATSVKVTNYTGNWTIRFMRTPGFWIGVDLGVRGTALDLKATGTSYLTGLTSQASFKSGLPMPQLGPSVGYYGLEGRLVLRGYYHYLGYKGATYRNAGADARFFPLPWLGVRVFTASESWKVPTDSISKDLAIELDRTGTGFGLVLKF